jgi:hypothetical protein
MNVISAPKKITQMHHETKTDIYQHSGSSVRVPIDGVVRSASTGLSLYQSDYDFDYPGTGNLTRPQKINDGGDIVGIYLDSSLVQRGFVRFNNGNFSAPIVEPNDTGNVTQGRGINNSRTVCGDYIGSDSFDHGFFLSGGTFTEYNIPDAIAIIPGQPLHRLAESMRRDLSVVVTEMLPALSTGS